MYLCEFLWVHKKLTCAGNRNRNGRVPKSLRLSKSKKKKNELAGQQVFVFAFWGGEKVKGNAIPAVKLTQFMGGKFGKKIGK